MFRDQVLPYTFFCPFFFSSFFFFPSFFNAYCSKQLLNNGKLKLILVLKIRYICLATQPDKPNQTKPPVGTTRGYHIPRHDTVCAPRIAPRGPNPTTTHRRLFTAAVREVYLKAWKQHPRQLLLCPLGKQKAVLFCKLEQSH